MNELSPLSPAGDALSPLNRAPATNAATPPEPAAPQGPNELLHLWEALVQRRKLLLGLGLSAAAVAAVLTLLMPSVYRSTVSLMVEPGRSRILSIEELRQGGDNRERFQAQVEILQSRDLAVRTARSLKLWDQADFDMRHEGSGPISLLKSLLSFGSKEPPTESQLLDHAADVLMEATRVEALRASGVAKISVENTDPNLAATIANAYAAQYVAADSEAHLNVAQNASGMLQERLSTLRDKLAASEAELQAYREKKGIVKLGGSAEAMATQTLNALTDRLVAAKARRADLEGTWSQLRNLRDDDYSGVSAVQRDPSVIEATTRVNQLRARVAEYSQKYGSQHTTLKEATAQLANAQAGLAAQRKAVIDGINREYQSSVAAEKELETQLANARGTAAGVNREEFQLAGLEREVDSNRQLYEMFLTRAKETSVAAEVHDAAARVIDPAVAARKPVGPKRGPLVLLAFVLATSLGAFVILVRQALDKTIKGQESAEQKLQLPVIGALPILPPEKQDSAAYLTLKESDSYYAEAIRTVRTGVLLSSIDSACKIVLVTSTLRGEGKTTVATNLALANAGSGRTLLIDADMRSPQAGMRLGISRQRKGLTNMLAGTDARECLHAVKGSQLYVLPAGDPPPNPQELLLSRRFRALLEALSRKFEMVIIDSPPVDPLSDALVLASIVPNTLLVVKSQTTPYPEIQKSVNRIRRTSTKILGIVLNHAELTVEQKRGYPYARDEEENVTMFLPEPS